MLIEIKKDHMYYLINRVMISPDICAVRNIYCLNRYNIALTNNLQKNKRALSVLTHWNFLK